MVNKVTTSLGQFSINVAKKLAPFVTSLQKEVENGILGIVQDELRQAFQTNPTIESLLGFGGNGEFSLQQEFGLTPDLAIDSVLQIIDAIVNSVEVKVTTSKKFILFGEKRLGGLEIILVPAYFQRELSRRFGYTSLPSDANIPWLQWLLVEGLRVVITDHRVVKSKSKKSRAGGVLMKKNGVYRVSPQHAGTIGDNFITREVASRLPTIINKIENHINSVAKRMTK